MAKRCEWKNCIIENEDDAILTKVIIGKKTKYLTVCPECFKAIRKEED